MITFYKADETDFDNNGLGVLDHDIQNPDIEEKLNDIFTFSFNYPIFGVNGSRLSARMIVKADDPENEGQLFRIMKLSKSNGMLTAFCYHIFYDLNGNEIPDTNIVGQNGQTAITQMLSKTAVGHKFQGFSDITDIANIRVVRMSPVKFLIDPQTDNNFINRLGGEIRRVNYRIWMNKVRGSDNGATIRWKKSLDSYNATWDYTTIATRIRPVGYNGIMLPESYVDSPLIDKYETISIKEIQYSDIKAIDPNATSNDETAVPLEQAYELLRQAAAKEFSGNNLDKPTVTLSVNMVALRNMDEYKDVKSLETINPWDTVTIINERDGLSVKVRLNHYHWNPVTHKFISMELGNAKSTFTDIGSKVDHATNLANQANDTANTAAESANGKNSNYYGPNEPYKPVDGDLWYKKNGDKTELWQYDGKSVPHGWKLVVDDATGEEVRQNVDAAQKEAEEAKKQANESVAAANDAVAKAGFANDTATQAKSDAAAAGQQAKDALTSAGTAITDAKKALTDSNSAMVDSAQARKDSATAIKDAADSLTSAKDALNKVGSLTTSVTSQFTTVNNELKSKVNQTDYDKLKGTVTTQQTEINQNASGIKLKADKSYADTINNSVVKNTSGIGLLNNQIALTVSKTELNNTLSSYATQTWTQSQIKSTADSINLSVTKVQNNLDNLAIGGRNYILKSGTYTANMNTMTRMYLAESIGYFSEKSIVLSCRVDFDNHVLGQKNRYGMETDLQGTDGKTYYVNVWKNASAGESFHGTIHALVNVPKLSPTNDLHEFWLYNQSATPNSTITKPKIEIGTRATDWSEAPEDNASAVEFSNLEVKVNGIQGTVQNKADQSQVTQLANQITSVVGSLNSPNLIPNSGMPTNTSFWSSNIPEMFTVMGSLGGYTKGKMFSLMNVQGTDKVSACTSLIPVSRNTKYTFSFLILGSDNVFGYDVWFLGRPFGETKPFTTQHQLINNLKPKPNYEVDYKTVTFTTGDDDEGYIRVDNNGSTASGQSVIFFTEVKLERGEKATPWDQTAEGTELIQTRNDINLRVEKGKVINQINISPEGILIDGEKVHITGQTRIDNAVIKDAMIADIKADKITAGTINAANVNVINLNANSITTGTLKGTNLSMNLNTGEVLFQHGRIHSASNNIDVNIDQGYLSTASNNTRVMLKEGQLQLVQPTIFDNSEDPYLEISNLVGGASLNGANIIARDYLVLANRANSNALLDAPIDVPETFAGLAVGKISSGKWKPTRIGGAERGIIMRGGTAYKIDSSFMYKSSPEIFVGTDKAGLKPSDRIYINGSYVHIISAYKRTASGGPNVVVAEDGALVRSTSASKYKTDIVRTNISNYGEKLLNLPTATWTDIAETKRYRDDPTTQPEPTRNFGMIAEDLADAGLEMLVVRGTDGELEGINYDRIGPALIPVIAKLKNKIEKLEQKLEEKQHDKNTCI